MKRAIIVLMLLAVSLTAGAFDFSEQAPTGQTLYYTITSSSTVKVTYPAFSWTGFDKPTGVLTIPATATSNGVTYSVTEIGTSAFSGCDGITTVVISEGIQSIGTLAFFQCSSLDSIVLPLSLTNIAITVFNSTAYVNNLSHWEDGLFLYCGDYLLSVRSNANGNIVLRDGTQGIAGLAIYNCDSIHNVTIPASMRFIGARAFDDCTGLDTIRMLGSVPPTLSYDVFEQGYGMVVAVPCGSVEAYQAAENWSNYTIVEYPCDTNQGESSTDTTQNDSVRIVPIDPDIPKPVPPFPINIGIDDVDAGSQFTVTTVSGGIMIENAAGLEVGVYDMMGHCVTKTNVQSSVQMVKLPASGVYIVAAGGRKAVKVVYLQ